VLKPNSSAASGAKHIGRDVSWVNRRLALIKSISDSVLTTICNGHLSTWSAARVIAPLARANSAHAETMVRFLEQHPLSTRELGLWDKHYHKASHSVRDEMVKDPALFLPALYNKEQDKQAGLLAAGPEGAWMKDMNITKAILKRQQSTIAMLFSSPRNESDQQSLRQAFTTIKKIMASPRVQG